jgi:hypothetical protein
MLPQSFLLYSLLRNSFFFFSFFYIPNEKHMIRESSPPLHPQHQSLEVYTNPETTPTLLGQGLIYRLAGALVQTNETHRKITWGTLFFYIFINIHECYKGDSLWRLHMCLKRILTRLTPPSFSLIPLTRFLEQFQLASLLYFIHIYKVHSPYSPSPFTLPLDPPPNRTCFTFLSFFFF